MTLCFFCGWGEQCKTQFGERQCAYEDEAIVCDLNLINRRKYELRNRPRAMPPFVKSVRYQGKEGKGDSFEHLVPIW